MSFTHVGLMQEAKMAMSQVESQSAVIRALEASEEAEDQFIRVEHPRSTSQYSVFGGGHWSCNVFLLCLEVSFKSQHEMCVFLLLSFFLFFSSSFPCNP